MLQQKGTGKRREQRVAKEEQKKKGKGRPADRDSLLPAQIGDKKANRSGAKKRIQDQGRKGDQGHEHRGRAPGEKNTAGGGPALDQKSQRSRTGTRGEASVHKRGSSSNRYVDRKPTRTRSWRVRTATSD